MRLTDVGYPTHNFYLRGMEAYIFKYPVTSALKNSCWYCNSCRCMRQFLITCLIASDASYECTTSAYQCTAGNLEISTKISPREWHNSASEISTANGFTSISVNADI